MASDKKGAYGESGLLGLNKISGGTTFKGDVVSNGDFRIDGRFEGTIMVGKDGSIEGTVNCADAEVEGTMSGVMNVKDVLSVKSSGTVSGMVCTNKLTIELGAIFDVTSCEMKG